MKNNKKKPDLNSYLDESIDQHYAQKLFKLVIALFIFAVVITCWGQWAHYQHMVKIENTVKRIDLQHREMEQKIRETEAKMAEIQKRIAESKSQIQETSKTVAQMTETLKDAKKPTFPSLSEILCNFFCPE
ncbi:hypothetical protein XELAEV_18043455mg [Xenopus laevis]|uniref:Uncharacterized protein n=1 Tax=Xenopus laevis TaxID=8355 RepID=A0A974H2V3_XENLA|nr:hypothetical protein XELAEV_18043455mg [Xenopus laevis]